MLTHITQYLEKTIETISDRHAVIDGERIISFSELYNESVHVGFSISKLLYCAINNIIAVFIEKSIDSVVADIGILYSGNAYMNLDSHVPPAEPGACIVSRSKRL